MEDLEGKLRSEFRKVIGKECWGIVAGAGTGSSMNVQIGNKILRTKPLDNTALAHDVRNFEAEYSIYIECVWRLDSDKGIICGAWDDNSKKGKMLQGLNHLLGNQITRIIILEPAYDLIIEFSNSFKLKVFCDQVNEKDGNDNYSLFTPTEIITVGNRSKLLTESRLA
jgi:hypothetical protein